MKHVVVFSLAVVLLAVACITEKEGQIFIILNTQPPDTTSDPDVTIAGEAFRDPRRTDPTVVVTITGGLATVVDTTNPFRLFEVTVPLVRNAKNRLSFSASDNTGAVSQNIVEVVIVQQDST